LIAWSCGISPRQRTGQGDRYAQTHVDEGRIGTIDKTLVGRAYPSPATQRAEEAVARTAEVIEDPDPADLAPLEDWFGFLWRTLEMQGQIGERRHPDHQRPQQRKARRCPPSKRRRSLALPGLVAGLFDATGKQETVYM
jgi:hypothetical protein